MADKEQLLLTDSPPKQPTANQRHADKIQYEINVDNEAFLDLVEIHAISMGGSSHLDENGRKYLFYPIINQSKKGQIGGMELAVLAHRDCRYNQQVGYQNGLQSQLVKGEIHYIEEPSQLKKNFKDESKIREFIVCLKKEKEGQTKKQVLELLGKMYESISVPIYEIDQRNFETVDTALFQMCKILGRANEVAGGQQRRLGYTVAALLGFSIFGILANTLLYFTIVMEEKQWDFHISIQFLIYIGFLVGVLIQYYFIILLCAYIGRKCQEKYQRWTQDKTSNFVLAFAPTFISSLVFGGAIAKLVLLIKNDPSTSLIFGIHLAIYSALVIIFAIVLLCYSNRDVSDRERRTKLMNYQKHKLQKTNL
ncbi:hypothetical protein FGO68_gene8753 [Halteria grandinella]|uniref:Uncharacterized protein n=1 Tax=Halteria grandinella TaxID=5974 RepID=A0A8J8NMK5_HALGN|nr:hypothetical protein FGO68_gene8753 [Halteria grandinella]